jgi:hypothetical protein
VQHTSSHTQLKIGRITAQLQEVAGPQLAQLQQLAGDSWRLPGHPGWRLVTEGLVSLELDHVFVWHMIDRHNRTVQPQCTPS